MWKDFFYFSRAEKQGIIVLVALITITISIGMGLSIYRKSQPDIAADNIEEEYNNFIASLKEADSIKIHIRQAQRDHYSQYDRYKKNQTIILAPFDPNTVDSITLRQMGLPGWMAQNILRYRNKGGRFRAPEEFRKIYGLTEEQYAGLLPYIYIDDEFRKKDTVRLAVQQHIQHRDTLTPFKYNLGTMIDLNAADTTELKKIPGIGSGIAKRIVSYRQKLGGFYDIKQLQEINLDARLLAGWFNIKEGETTRINLNTVGIERLRAHPYFNFYQAKVIIEYRKRKGNLKRLNQLALYEEFTDEDMERMKHYVRFE